MRRWRATQVLSPAPSLSERGVLFATRRAYTPSLTQCFTQTKNPSKPTGFGGFFFVFCPKSRVFSHFSAAYRPNASPKPDHIKPQKSPLTTCLTHSLTTWWLVVVFSIFWNEKAVIAIHDYRFLYQRTHTLNIINGNLQVIFYPFFQHIKYHW